MAEATVLSKYESIKVVPLAVAAIGEVVAFDEVLGIFLTAFTAAMLADGDSATLVVKAEKVEVTKNAGETWVAGEFVFWDAANSEFTNVEGAATVLCGIIAEAAVSAAVLGYIKFNGELQNIRGNGEFAYGSQAVTGDEADVDTGLSLIQGAVACVKETAQGAGDAGYCTVDHGADGLLDIYCWDDAGVAATVAATVYWMAWGLK